jgi:hypothetical protein
VPESSSESDADEEDVDVESDSASDDSMPPLEPNRNKTHNRIGGESRRSRFPQNPRDMPPSESDSTESEPDEAADLAARVAAAEVRD